MTTGKEKKITDSNAFGSNIYNVCDECGLEANRLTCLSRYGREPIKKKFDISTYHKGYCDWCGKLGMLTEVRDFFYPDFKGVKNEPNKRE